MEVRILQIPEEEFKILLCKVDRIEAGQKRIIAESESEVVYTSDEVCKIIKCSPKTLQNWRDKGLIEYVQLGSVIRYTKKAVHAFMSSNSFKATA